MALGLVKKEAIFHKSDAAAVQYQRYQLVFYAQHLISNVSTQPTQIVGTQRH
jgi:hypothetical protein